MDVQNIPDRPPVAYHRTGSDYATKAWGVTAIYQQPAIIRDGNGPVRPPAPSSVSARPNLEIGPLQDPLEREADCAATDVSVGRAPRTTLSTQRRRRRESIEPAGALRNAPPIVHDALCSAGEPLDVSTRAHFETRFGRDFSHVRVHADGRAAESADAVGARAYTVGHRIVFGHNEYDRRAVQRLDEEWQDPRGVAGAERRKLLAHELTHVVQDEATPGAPILRREPKHGSEGDIPVRGRVRRSDIAGRDGGQAWQSQFAPQKPPADPTHVSSIKQAQQWVTDLDGFTHDEAQRYRIGELLKTLIEQLPPEVWLPSGVLGRYADKRSTLTVAGGAGPIDTGALRNKLFTMYVSVDHPQELTKPRDPTGLIWGADFNIEQFITDDDREAQRRYGVMPDPQPFQLSRDPFTRREVDVLEFLFSDQMLEWRRRDVALQESVQRELDRRNGVFMAALGDGSIKAIGQFFKYSALGGVGLAAAAPVSSGLAGSLGIESLSTASWGARLIVGTGTGEVIGAGTGALDRAISDVPDLVSGDISVGEYAEGIGGGAWSGAKGGAVFGFAGEVVAPVLSPVIGQLRNWILPEAKPIGPLINPRVEPSGPPIPRTEPIVRTPPRESAPVSPKATTAQPSVPAGAAPDVAPTVPSAPLKAPKTGLGSWVARRARAALASIKLGFARADVVPDMQVGYAKGKAALVDSPKAPPSAATAPAPKTELPTPAVEADVATPAAARTGPSDTPTPAATVPAAATQPSAAPSSSLPSPGSASSLRAVPSTSAPAAPAGMGAPTTASVQSEAQQRVALIEQMQNIVEQSAQIGRDAIANGDRAILSEFLYPREVARALQGDAPFLGIFVEWRARYMFALDPLVQPHVGRGGYLGERYVIGRTGPRRGFADFFGTPEGLLPNTPIEITTTGGLAAHLNRYYLKRGLILTY
jgi:hypothetical protein